MDGIISALGYCKLKHTEQLPQALTTFYLPFLLLAFSIDLSKNTPLRASYLPAYICSIPTIL